MCATCGCSKSEVDRSNELYREPGRDHSRSRLPTRRARKTVPIERALLEKNQRFAARNRAWLDARGCVAFNVMGSPGAGKTALLEAIVQHSPDLSLSVIEGDQATERDAERIRRAGCHAIQINTGTGCHLTADAVLHGLQQLGPAPGSRLILENVGNLVCPALFDLGETARIVVLSVTEGDDKPLKYPHMFRACDALVLNKIDLLPHVSFDRARALADARALNPQLVSFEVSATRGDGIAAFCAWLRSFGGARPRHAAESEAPSEVTP